jgi:HSP20 family protein
MMMKLSDLIPWSGARQAPPARQDRNDPLSALQADINRAFGDFWASLGPAPWDRNDSTEVSPRIDVRDAGKVIEIIAELPGLDESDIKLSLADGMLGIRGEKKVERTAKNKGYVLQERSYGAMERIVPIPEGLDLDSAQANFKNGTLTVTIPKKAETDQATKRIPVQAA